jgi:hypothetical protein
VRITGGAGDAYLHHRRPNSNAARRALRRADPEKRAQAKDDARFAGPSLAASVASWHAAVIDCLAGFTSRAGRPRWRTTWAATTSTTEGQRRADQQAVVAALAARGSGCSQCHNHLGPVPAVRVLGGRCCVPATAVANLPRSVATCIGYLPAHGSAESQARAALTAAARPPTLPISPLPRGPRGTRGAAAAFEGSPRRRRDPNRGAPPRETSGVAVWLLRSRDQMAGPDEGADPLPEAAPITEGGHRRGYRTGEDGQICWGGGELRSGRSTATALPHRARQSHQIGSTAFQPVS